jgi:ferredoxin
MANKNDKGAKNVPGKYYVDNSCINCGLCSGTAPENFQEDSDAGVHYVYKQPNSAAETANCVQAKDGCPVEAIGDDGE